MFDNELERITDNKCYNDGFSECYNKNDISAITVQECYS